ncbi:MAG: hypothetical protein A2428_01050 [Bdellovibrionales bacterium RIFOXYC1_FULL_54_43]|nr:MAG: hypothetical protein A2428_01050 [Bdellovibrionales bacterium RIFOXYC1_FULL_54_43]OFZ82872.1 MAG: hypothetical protein A2603_11775 [Bdellovibrionales bacterium RIFOXYD1_FULL_55_31]
MKLKTINRIAVTVTFKKKFLDWVNQLPDAGDLKFSLNTLNRDKPIYLVPAYEDTEEAAEWFGPMKTVVLEEAFESICTEPKWWPTDRSERAFDDYLSAEFHSMVWDLVVDEPIEKEY